LESQVINPTSSNLGILDNLIILDVDAINWRESVTRGSDLGNNSNFGAGVDTLVSRKIGYLCGKNQSHSYQNHRDCHSDIVLMFTSESDY